MNREETKRLLMLISATYPNYKPNDPTLAIDAWLMNLGEYSWEEMTTALMVYNATNTTGFAPSVGQLIDKLHRAKAGEEMNELEAWALVYKAICNSAYNAESEFEKLPDPVRRAVGRPETLKEWAAMDIDTVKSVEQSHFVRMYRSAVKTAEEERKLPENLKVMIGKIREAAKQLDGETQRMIGTEKE